MLLKKRKFSTVQVLKVVSVNGGNYAAYVIVGPPSPPLHECLGNRA